MPSTPAIGPRSKKLPHFGDFVRQSPHSKLFDEHMGNAAFIGFLISLIPGFFLFRSIGWLGILATAVFVLPLCVSICEKIAKKRLKISQAEEKRLEELNVVMRRLRGYLDSGRLHRHLEPVAAALLEECAKSWKRIHEALEGPAWSQETLPAHYRSIRDQAFSAANRGIEDLVLLLQTSIRSQPKTEEWQVAFTRFLGEVVGISVEQEEAVEPFPIEYVPAKEIVVRMVRLADDIETTTRRLLSEDFVKEQFSSTASLDAVLSELRAIDVAEDELHQNLRA